MFTWSAVFEQKGEPHHPPCLSPPHCKCHVPPPQPTAASSRRRPPLALPSWRGSPPAPDAGTSYSQSRTGQARRPPPPPASQTRTPTLQSPPRIWPPARRRWRRTQFRRTTSWRKSSWPPSPPPDPRRIDRQQMFARMACGRLPPPPKCIERWRKRWSVKI